MRLPGPSRSTQLALWRCVGNTTVSPTPRHGVGDRKRRGLGWRRGRSGVSVGQHVGQPSAASAEQSAGHAWTRQDQLAECDRLSLTLLLPFQAIILPSSCSANSRMVTFAMQREARASPAPLFVKLHGNATGLLGEFSSCAQGDNRRSPSRWRPLRGTARALVAGRAVIDATREDARAVLTQCARSSRRGESARRTRRRWLEVAVALLRS